MMSLKRNVLVSALVLCLGIVVKADAKVCFLVGGCADQENCYGAGCNKIPTPPICENKGYTRTKKFCCTGADNGVEWPNDKVKNNQFELKADNNADAGSTYIVDTYNFFSDKSNVKWNNKICAYVQDEFSGSCDSRDEHYAFRCKCNPDIYKYTVENDSEDNYIIRTPSCRDEAVDDDIFGKRLDGTTHYMYKVCENKYPYTKDTRTLAYLNSKVLLTNVSGKTTDDYAHYELKATCHTAADGLNRSTHTQSYNQRYSENTNKLPKYDDDKWISVALNGTDGHCVDKYDIREENEVTRYSKCICPKATYKYPDDDAVLKISGATNRSHTKSGNYCLDSGTSHDDIKFYTDATCSGQSAVRGSTNGNGYEAGAGGHWREVTTSGYRCEVDVTTRSESKYKIYTNKVANLRCNVYAPRTCSEFHTANGNDMSSAPRKGWRIEVVGALDSGGGLHKSGGTDCGMKCYSFQSGPCQVGDFMNSQGYCSGASSVAAAKQDFQKAKDKGDDVAVNVIGMVSVSSLSGDTRTIRVVAIDEPTDTYSREKSTAKSRIASYSKEGVGNWRLMTNLDVNGLLEAKDSNGNLRKLHEHSDMKLKTRRTNLWATLIDGIKKFDVKYKGKTVVEIGTLKQGKSYSGTPSKDSYAFADIYQCYWVDYAGQAVERAVLPKVYADDDNGVLENNIASKDNMWPRFSYHQHIYMRKQKINPNDVKNVTLISVGSGAGDPPVVSIKYTYELPFWYSISPGEYFNPTCLSCAVGSDTSYITLSDVLYGRPAYKPFDGKLNNYLPLSYGARYYLEGDDGVMYFNKANSNDAADQKVWPKGVQPWRIGNMYARVRLGDSAKGACNGSGSGFACHMRMYYKGGGAANWCSNWDANQDSLYSNDSGLRAGTCFTENEKGSGGSALLTCNYIWDYRGGVTPDDYGSFWAAEDLAKQNPYYGHVHDSSFWLFGWWWKKGWKCYDPNGQTFRKQYYGVSDWYQRGIQGCFTRGAKQFKVKVDGSNWVDDTHELSVTEAAGVTADEGSGDMKKYVCDENGQNCHYEDVEASVQGGDEDKPLDISQMTPQNIIDQESELRTTWCSNKSDENAKRNWNVVNSCVDEAKAVISAESACDSATSAYNSAAVACSSASRAYVTASRKCNTATATAEGCAKEHPEDYNTACLDAIRAQANACMFIETLQEAKEEKCGIKDEAETAKYEKCGGNGYSDPRSSAQTAFDNAKDSVAKNSDENAVGAFSDPTPCN